MKRISLNADWTVRPLSRRGEPKRVNLPHDAMIDEPRSPKSQGEGNIGWYIGGDYEYTKTLSVPAEWAGKKALIEFEGVYHNAEVFINGEPAAFRPYGYTNFYVEAGKLLNYGADNELKVIARNADQPNSRWYSGTGIYRPVSLWLGDEAHILVNGVRIRTLDYKKGEIEVHVRTSRPGEMNLEILDGDEVVVSQRHASQKRSVRFRVTLKQPKLWSPDHPNLYTARVTFGDDVVEETFGVRTLAWSPKEGMTINGERVILRGACVHHDNGPLGACAFPEAEERKVRIMKENGYNALRSAHNPCSKAMLDACDRLGMLMMDEYVDAWTMHKTKYDYVTYLKDWWKQDLKDMVEKDYNHPCVIMYSTGNEVAETAKEAGIQFTGEMTRYLHELDDSRPVSCGINIFFNFLSSLGMGVYSDEKAEKQSAAAAEKRPGKPKKKAVGSEFYNKLACMMGDKFMKWGATLHGSDVKTRGAFANMDIAGYNYGIWRYEKDMKRYPDRLILGSETFCKDAWLFWDIAKNNPPIIGDFVWAGMDYIGETGMGAPEYGDYKLAAEETQMTGGNGRVDITGKPRAEAAYTRVALEQQTAPAIGVQPVNRDDNPNLTGWTLTKAIESWAWTGCAGRLATVEVYARAAEVELKLNNRSLGRKKADKTCRTLFKVPWEAGKLEAVSYDDVGKVIGTCALHSAGAETELRLLPETASVKPNGLCFVRLRFTDKRGVWKPLEHRKLTASVENGELAGLCSANSYIVGNYNEPTTDTYYGEALAILRAKEGGSVTLTVTAEGMDEPATLVVPVLDEEPILLEHPTEPEGLDDFEPIPRAPVMEPEEEEEPEEVTVNPWPEEAEEEAEADAELDEFGPDDDDVADMAETDALDGDPAELEDAGEPDGDADDDLADPDVDEDVDLTDSDEDVDLAEADGDDAPADADAPYEADAEPAEAPAD